MPSARGGFPGRRFLKISMVLLPGSSSGLRSATTGNDNSALGHLGAGTGSSPFQDVDDPLITALYEAGLVEGVLSNGGRRFLPDETLSRAELCALVQRIRNYTEGQTTQSGSVSPGTTDPETPEIPADEPPDSSAATQNPGASQTTDRIPFGNQSVAVVPGVPVCSYQKEGYGQKNGRMTYSWTGVTAEFGVDVSSHQGPIKWAEVARDGVSFAIIRAGGRYYGKDSGTIFPDIQFASNMKGAMAQGIDVDVYFFSQAISDQEAREEAQFVVDRLKDYPDFNGYVVFDWENIGTEPARTDRMTAPEVTSAALEFCQVIQSAGYRPMIYFNRYIAYYLYELDQVDQYPFWIADYQQTPTFYYDFQIWQYADDGAVKGITGKVDADLRFRR